MYAVYEDGRFKYMHYFFLSIFKLHLFLKSIIYNPFRLVLTFILISGVSQETLNQSMGGSSRANSLPRPISPTPSVASEKYEGDLQVCTIIAIGYPNR